MRWLQLWTQRSQRSTFEGAFELVGKRPFLASLCKCIRLSEDKSDGIQTGGHLQLYRPSLWTRIRFHSHRPQDTSGDGRGERKRAALNQGDHRIKITVPVCII